MSFFLETDPKCTAVALDYSICFGRTSTSTDRTRCLGRVTKLENSAYHLPPDILPNFRFLLTASWLSCLIFLSLSCALANSLRQSSFLRFHDAPQSMTFHSTTCAFS